MTLNFQVSRRHQSSNYSKANELEEFIKYFVKEFEDKLYAYHLILEGVIKKAGKFSDAFSEKVGQGVGGAACGFVGLLLGSSIAGAKFGASAGKVAGKKIGSMVGNKKYIKNVTKLLDLIDLSQKDKSNFRRLLVEAGFDVFQSFEMQFMRVTTDQGQKKAIHQLAKDATNRAIMCLKENTDISLSESVILGKSKKEAIHSINPGFEIQYEYKSCKKVWYTASLYDKTGIVIEDRTSSYYKKKDGNSMTTDYGYRRLLIQENWDKLKETYASDNIVKSNSGQFTDYQYIVNPRDLEKRSKNILDNLNSKDENLEEERLKEILDENKNYVLDVINILKDQSNQYLDDHKILTNMETNLKNLNIDEYLQRFEQYFEIAKQDRQKIATSVDAGQEENRERFNQLSKQENIHYDDNKREYKKTQEGIERVEESIEGNSKKINEIHEVIIAHKIAETKKSIWFDMREPVKSFTGRVSELEILYNALQNKGRQTVISQTTSITGLGGIGKSELARKYAYDYRKDYDDNVIWINSETRESLKVSFLELAKKLKIPIKETNERGNEDLHLDYREIKSIVKDVYEYFMDVRSLFIFDNAEEHKGIYEFLPSSLSPDNEKPYILITSRNQDWEVGEEGSIEALKLNDFTPKEAAEFIKIALGFKKDHNNSCDVEINKLATLLQCFPLALQQATAYINERNTILKTRGKNFGVNDYLIEYIDYLIESEEVKKLQLLDFKSKYANYRYIETVFTTWKITLKNIMQKGNVGQQALEILNIISYLASDKVPIEGFFSELVGDEEKLWSAVELLKQYSMINIEEGVSNIHRLVQEVIRAELGMQKKEECVLRSALKLINGSKDATHIVSIWKYASKYSKLIDYFYLNSIYGENKSTPLHLLADSGEDKAIENILKRITKRNIGCEDIYGRTPLYRAASNGHKKLVELLVNSGASLHGNSASAPSWFATKWTVLHVVAYMGHTNVAQFLIEKGADINVKDSIGRDALYIAINRGNEDVAKLLDKTGESLLFISASLGKLELVEDILKHESELDKKEKMTNPTQQGKCGPLHIAAYHGYLDVVKLLVKNGADINNSAYDGHTPLHMAAAEGHLDVVEFLVQEAIRNTSGKFDILKVSRISGWTVLHSAAQNGHTEVLKYVINEFSKGKKESVNKALINIADMKGTTLLQTAAFHNKLDTVKFLIGKNADINATDIFGATPLFAAAICNNYTVVEYLLKQDNIRIHCDLQKVLGILDITPLHAAAVFDNLDMLKLLLKRTRINAGEKSSFISLHVAAFFDSPKVIKFLIDNGENTNARINFSNIVNVLNFIKGDLKEGYGSQFINYIMTALTFFLGIPLVGKILSSQCTPRVISTAFKYNNLLVQRDDNGQVNHSIVSRGISLLLFLPSAEKQLKIMKDYVDSVKSCGPVPPVGEDSIFYDITNMKSLRPNNT